MKKEINWNLIGWRSLQGLIVLVLNAATLFFLISNLVDVYDGMSYWVVLSSNWWKAIFESQEIDIPQWLASYEYHWYNKFLVYFFMGLGAWISILFIKFLYKEHRQDKRQNKQTNDLKKIVKDEKEKEKNEKTINRYIG